MNPRISLGLLLFSATTALAADRIYPPSSAVIDVTMPPYSARGDGVTDDTEAIQRAINEHTGRHRVIFFPKGTYLISATLKWPNHWQGRNNWGFTKLHGQDRDSTILRLKENTFPNAREAGSIMWCGGFGSADWFFNYIENLTFEVTPGNAGGIALQFYSNNGGAVRDCRFIAAEGTGLVGLDLAHRDMNGPLLVRNCEVRGFERGITTGRAVNSQTFEFISLNGQRGVGFENTGQAISIRGLISENAVPAISTYGTFLLMESRLIGLPGAERSPAIVNYNGGRIFVRDLSTSGYLRALADMETPDYAAAFRITGDDKPGSLGPDIAEYCSAPVTSPFPSPSQSIRLPVKETPDVPWDPLAQWANVDDFGADPTGEKDSAEAIQKAIDSGAATIFLPGAYQVSRTILVRGKARRIVGTGAWIDYLSKTKPNFRIVDGDAPVVVFEHLAGVNGGIEIDTRRTLLFRSVEIRGITSTAAAEGAEIFFEDCVTHHLVLTGRKVWARQLNIENEGTHLVNDRGDVWILGYKTERGGTLIDTRGGGRTEVLGGFSYTTTAGKLAPMIVNRDSSVFTYFTEVCFTGDPFAVRIEETRAGETRAIGREEGSTVPYSGRKVH
jgi:hypothetical protein